MIMKFREEQEIYLEPMAQERFQIDDLNSESGPASNWHRFKKPFKLFIQLLTWRTLESSK